MYAITSRQTRNNIIVNNHNEGKSKKIL